MEKSKRSEVLGIPLVLVVHAVILTILLGVVMFVMILRMVSVPLYDMNRRLQTLELQPAPVSTVTPTATPSAIPSPTVIRSAPRSISPAATKTE